METPTLKVQEIALDHPDSRYLFAPTKEKPFLATAAAIKAYREDTILQCLRILQEKAKRYGGLDYFQVFLSSEPATEDLWFIEDDGQCRRAITALLPSDY